MKPVEQTIVAAPGGNCFAACVASVLELPLEAVPNYQSGDWYDQWQTWLAARNLTLLTFSIQDSMVVVYRPRGYSILAADSPRFPGWTHAVVCYDGEIVWDPSPHREKGVGAWREWVVLGVIDPSKV